MHEQRAVALHEALGLEAFELLLHGRILRHARALAVNLVSDLPRAGAGDPMVARRRFAFAPEHLHDGHLGFGNVLLVARHRAFSPHGFC